MAGASRVKVIHMHKQNVIESFAFLLSYFLDRSVGDEDDAAVRDNLKTWANARIYQGDSRALLQKLPEAVMDLTDEELRPQLVASFELPAGGVWAHADGDPIQP